MTQKTTNGTNRVPHQGSLSCPCPSGTAYEIRVKDHLETYWFEWFEGWTVTNLEDEEVLLSSTSVDQSGLHGALNKIRDLNLTLLSVIRVNNQGSVAEGSNAPDA
jgi:hypothetical protein